MIRAAAIVASLLVAQAAGADEVRLDYRAPAACPSAAAVSRAVSARLGRDGFADGAAIVVRASIEPDPGGGWRATIDWVEAGEVTGTRTLSSPERACLPLAAAVALALAIAIDPLADTGEPIVLEAEPAPPAPPPPPPPTPAPTPAPAPPAAPAPAPLEWSAGAGPVATLGAAPAWTPAIAAEAEAARGRLAVAVHLQLHAPRAQEFGPGEVSGWLATASLVPCYRWRSLAGCAVASGGFVRGGGRGGFDQARDATTLYAGLGARAHWTWWWSARIGSRVWADGQLALARTVLTVNDLVAWRQPRASAGLGVLALARW